MSSITIPSKIIGGKKTEQYKLIVDNKIKDEITNLHYSINKINKNQLTKITKDNIKLYYLQVLNIISNYNIIEIKDDLNIDDEHLITFYIKKLFTYFNDILQQEVSLVDYHLTRIKKEFKINDNLINSLNYLNNKLDELDYTKVRGIFSHDNNQNKNWSKLLVNNELPHFKNTEECIKFTTEVCKFNSNPKYRNLQHIFTTLIDWQQIEQLIIPKIYEFQTEKSIKVLTNKKKLFKENIYLSNENHKIKKNIDDLFNLKIYKNISLESTLNTFDYLFNHMRSGIYVMVRKSKVVIFAPFVNKDYTNTWSENIKFDSSDNTKETYYKEKLKYYRKENIIQDIKKWWVNSNIIDNEHCTYNRNGIQQISDQYLMELRDLLDNSCKYRNIPDCDFFINKRDYPQLKKTLSEPYGFMFNKDDKNKKEDVQLTRCKYESYTPIFSFYTSDIFADIPFPCVEDWLISSNNIYPKTCFHYKNTDNLKCNDNYTKEKLESLNTKWEDKQDIAFFRGSATGGGVTTETNQRLNIAQMSYDLGENKYLDAKLTSWNIRDKKILDHPITYIKPDKFQFTASKDNYVQFIEQSKYKYLLYIEGHSAANRYSFLMKMNCVILKVKSTVIADKLWYFPLLEPYIDHIPIESDLSNLIEVIEWCKNNDDKCKIIAENAKKFYNKYINKDSLYDYIELICNKINNNYMITNNEYKTNNINELSNLKDIIIKKINNNKDTLDTNHINLKKIYDLSIRINKIKDLLNTIVDSDLLFNEIIINNEKDIYNKKNYTLLQLLLNKLTNINMLYVKYFIEYEKLYNLLIDEIYKLTENI